MERVREGGQNVSAPFVFTTDEQISWNWTIVNQQGNGTDPAVAT